MNSNDKNTPKVGSKPKKKGDDMARSIFERWTDDEEVIVAHIIGNEKDSADK